MIKMNVNPFLIHILKSYEPNFLKFIYYYKKTHTNTIPISPICRAINKDTQACLKLIDLLNLIGLTNSSWNNNGLSIIGWGSSATLAAYFTSEAYIYSYSET